MLHHSNKRSITHWAYRWNTKAPKRIRTLGGFVSPPFEIPPLNSLEKVKGFVARLVVEATQKVKGYVVGLTYEG